MYLCLPCAFPSLFFVTGVQRCRHLSLSAWEGFRHLSLSVTVSDNSHFLLSLKRNDKLGPLVKKFRSERHHSGQWGGGGGSEILLYDQFLVSRFSTHPNSPDSKRHSLAVLMGKSSKRALRSQADLEGAPTLDQATHVPSYGLSFLTYKMGLMTN